MNGMTTKALVPDYGIDAPGVLRNLFVIGTICLILHFVLPPLWRVGPITFELRAALLVVGLMLLVQAFLYLYYVKRGKLTHRDRQLALHTWQGDEQVLDVGCGRGLLLVGAAKRLRSGHAIGIDVWSNVDLSGNSMAATMRNLELEGVTECAEVQTMRAEAMTFADASFDVVVSNLCLHNIEDRAVRQKALQEIVRVLRAKGVALISDFKLTRQYKQEFLDCGLHAERLWGAWYNFPPMRIVVARK